MKNSFIGNPTSFITDTGTKKETNVDVLILLYFVVELLLLTYLGRLSLHLSPVTSLTLLARKPKLPTVFEASKRFSNASFSTNTSSSISQA